MGLFTEGIKTKAPQTSFSESTTRDEFKPDQTSEEFLQTLDFLSFSSQDDFVISAVEKLKASIKQGSAAIRTTSEETWGISLKDSDAKISQPVSLFHIPESDFNSSDRRLEYALLFSNVISKVPELCSPRTINPNTFYEHNSPLVKKINQAIDEANSTPIYLTIFNQNQAA